MTLAAVIKSKDSTINTLSDADIANLSNTKIIIKELQRKVLDTGANKITIAGVEPTTAEDGNVLLQRKTRQITHSFADKQPGEGVGEITLSTKWNAPCDIDAYNNIVPETKITISGTISWDDWSSNSNSYSRTFIIDRDDFIRGDYTFWVSVTAPDNDYLVTYSDVYLSDSSVYKVKDMSSDQDDPYLILEGKDGFNAVTFYIPFDVWDTGPSALSTDYSVTFTVDAPAANAKDSLYYVSAMSTGRPLYTTNHKITFTQYAD